MKMEELMELYNPMVLVDIYYKGEKISISTAPNITQIYAGSKIKHFDVAHTADGDGRLAVYLKEAYEYGKPYEEWRKEGDK